MIYNYKADPVFANAPERLQDRYEIYHTAALSLGWNLKTFPEWLSS